MMPMIPPPAFIGMPIPPPPPPRPGKLKPPPPPWPRRSWMRLASVLRIFVTEEGYAGPAPAKRTVAQSARPTTREAHAEADHDHAAGRAHPLEAAG